MSNIQMSRWSEPRYPRRLVALPPRSKSTLVPSGDTVAEEPKASCTRRSSPPVTGSQ